MPSLCCPRISISISPAPICTILMAASARSSANSARSGCSPPAGESVDVMLYMGLEDFAKPDRCQHLFTGEMKAFDTITHMVLNNQINDAEKMYICMLNPMQTRTPAIGLLSGIGSSPFFAPIALKTLISKEPLEENDRLLNSIKLDKDDYHLLKYYNMMVVNRPAALFLE